MNRSGGRTTRLLRVLVALASIAVFGALAAPVSADPPGNNGTVKVHDGPSSQEPEPSEMRNVPHVGCVFHIHGYNFDSEPAQSGDWQILAWPPTGNGELADSGTYTTMANAEFEVDVDLTDWIAAHPSDHNQGSHFKLFVEGRNGTAGDGTFETTQVKHKVFWVDCGDVSGGQPGGVDNGGGNGGGNGGPTGGAPAGGAPSGGVLGSQGGPGGGMLPDTSVPFALTASLGAVLLAAAGVASAMRRRD